MRTMGDGKIIAIILLRGGSKGISRKNIRSLAGKPLIAYSIEASLKSRYLNKVVVSTEEDLKPTIEKLLKDDSELAKNKIKYIEKYLYRIDRNSTEWNVVGGMIANRRRAS